MIKSPKIIIILGDLKMGRLLTVDEFITKSRNKHGDKYDYSKVLYKGQKPKVIIICSTHGDFIQSPSDHLQGNGCQQCCVKNTRYTQDEFITLAKAIHNNKYDYSKLVYKNKQTKVIIGCSIHGDFQQRANDHTRGIGCIRCGNIKWTLEALIEKGAQIHKSKYTYKSVDNIARTIILECKTHGEFIQSIQSHISGSGCSKCYRSKGEEAVAEVLEENNFSYKTQKTFPKCINPLTNRKLKFDFFVPDKNLLIEYDGPQHFKPTHTKGFYYTKEIVEVVQAKDKVKDDFALLHGYALLRIPYKCIKQTKEIVKNVIEDKGLIDNKSKALIKIWGAMLDGARKYVRDEGFTEIVGLPALTNLSGSCEAVSNIFSLDYFDTQAFLAQSNQLHLEKLTQTFGSVYAEVLSFRKESLADNRHLTQFNLFEIEFLGGLDKLLYHLSNIIKSTAANVLTTCSEELAVFRKDVSSLQNLQFHQMTYEDAISYLNTTYNYTLQFNDDLKSEHELLLTKDFGPTFVTHYSKVIKFFNMREDPSDPRMVRSTDLLLPGVGESAGAAERETNYDKLQARLKTSTMYQQMLDLGLTDKDFEWYLDYHKDGLVKPHSGAGIGMARVAQFILGLDDIRDAVPFLINSENLI